MPEDWLTSAPGLDFIGNQLNNNCSSETALLVQVKYITSSGIWWRAVSSSCSVVASVLLVHALQA